MISAYRDSDAADTPPGTSSPVGWSWLLEAAHEGPPGTPAPASPLVEQLAPVVTSAIPAHRPLVIAHLAQSLDGRIALPDGESQWITGADDLTHTHRLRALCDAVLVGANTVACDDPRLTVRRCSGPHPLRIVVDPSGRLPADRTIYSDGHPTLRICREGTSPLPGVSDLPVGEAIDLPDLLARLRQRGVRRLFVEGGGVTLAHLLAARVVDRLHLVMAPLLVGEGRASVSGVVGATLADCPRPTVRVSPLGTDWLFDCSFASGTP